MEQTLSIIGVNPTKTLIYAYLLMLPRFVAALSFLTFLSTGIIQGKTIRNATIMSMALILLPLTQEQLPSMSFEGMEILIIFMTFIGLQ